MQLEELNNQLIYSPEVLKLVKLSNNYCMLLEGLPGSLLSDQEDDSGYDSKEILQQPLGGSALRKLFLKPLLADLSGIYSVMHSVKQPEPAYDDGNEKHVTEQDWSAIFQNIAQLTGPHNEYLRQVDEDEYDRSDLVTHTISEDLSDIYQELRDFTALYSRGIEEVMNDALWELMENFEEHWGEKLLNALSAMHKIYVSKDDLTDNDGFDENQD